VDRPRAVARGVELFPARTPTLPPATHTNSYALGTREVVLVEPATPYEDERRAWVEWARAIESSGRRLVALFLTHHHPDHVGGAAFLAAELGLPVWAHPGTAVRTPGVAIARTVVDGEDLVLDGPAAVRWRALHTPGHAPGHLCLHDAEQGVIVCGDMVASEGTILIDTVDGDMAEYLRQLERLAALDARLALPAHGEPIDAPSKLFRHYIAHRIAREAKVLAATRSASPEGAPAAALVPIAYADTSPLLWPIARLSLEAHLVKLEAEGRVRRTPAGWSVADPRD